MVIILSDPRCLFSIQTSSAPFIESSFLRSTGTELEPGFNGTHSWTCLGSCSSTTTNVYVGIDAQY